MLKLSNRIIILLTALLLCNSSTWAHHIYGADISYTHVSGSTYLITALVYQDCGTTTTPSGSIGIKGINGSSPSGSASSACCSKDITPRASSKCDLCSNSTCSFSFGIRQWTITNKVDLGVSKDCEFIFYYSDCCDFNGDNLYVECSLNRCHGDQDGPVYQFEPVTLACVNVIYDRFQTVTSGNINDSIRYELTDPLSGPGNPISYPLPFSFTAPITYTGTDPDATFRPPLGSGFHYGAATGGIQFRPTKVETSDIGMMASEYRRDSSGKYYLFGTTMRRAAINVLKCNGNSPPYITRHLSGIANAYESNGDSLYVCANLPMTFNIRCYDVDLGDSVTLTEKNETGGKIYKGYASLSNWPVDSFVWTPKNKDVRPQPYWLTTTATDRFGSPIPGNRQKRFYIFVKDSFPATAIKITDSGCGRYHIGLFPVPDKSYKLSYTWKYDTTVISTKGDFSYKNTLAGKHTISLVLNNTASGCGTTLAAPLNYDTLYHKLADNVSICKGDVVPLHAVSNKNLTWNPTKYLSDSTVANPYAKPDVTTVYTATSIDAKGCTYTDQEKITVSDFKIKKSADQAVCNGKLVKIGISHVPGASVLWTIHDTVKQGITDSISFYGTATYVFKVKVNLNGCIKSDSIKVTVHPSRIDLGPDRNVCSTDTAVLFASGGSSYKWYNRAHIGTLLSTDSVFKFRNFNFLPIGIPFELIMIDRKTGCSDTGDIKLYGIKFNPQDTLESGSVCKGDSLKFSASGGDSYEWSFPGIGTFTQSTVTIKPKYSINATITTKTKTGCSFTNTKYIRLPEHTATYKTIFICSGDTAYLSARTGTYYKWDARQGINNPTMQTQKVVPDSSITYTVIVRDPSQCIVRDTQRVTVYQDCVWPGDANKDKTADYLDVLNIGLGYGINGPARGNPNTSWQKCQGLDWSNLLASGVNYKHIDCNGDGAIDAGDTSVISANYGKKHNKWTPGSGIPADPHIYFKFIKDTFYAGETATAYLYAGDASHPLKNAYGIGFQAQHVATPMVANTAQYFAECGYFCTGTELNYFHPDYGNNSTDATVVETRGKPSPNTTGKFAGIKFLLKDSLSFAYPKNGEKIYAKLMSATVIDSTGKEINIFGVNDSAIVLKSKHKKNSIDDNGFIPGLKIYPNPANSELMIETGNTMIQNMKVYNAVGQAVLEIQDVYGTKTINISTLSPGLYYIELKKDTNTYRQKFLIQR